MSFCICINLLAIAMYYFLFQCNFIIRFAEKVFNPVYLPDEYANEFLGFDRSN